MNSQLDYKPSEGEEFIEDYFNVVKIKFETQKRISNLRNDTKQFRTADFYLPQYNVYVEFFGLWNNSGNEDYKIKKEVYKQNRIACVYLYPENLGIIDYVFDKRIQKVLEYNKLKNELFRYRFFKLKNSPDLRNRIGFTLFVSFLIVYELFFKRKFEHSEWILVTGLLAIFGYQCYQIFQVYQDIFKRNKYTLENIG